MPAKAKKPKGEVRTVTRIQGLKFDVGDQVVYEKLDEGTVEMLRDFATRYAEHPDPEWKAAAQHAEGEIQAHQDAVGKTFTVADHIYPGANPFMVEYKGFMLCISGDCLSAA